MPTAIRLTTMPGKIQKGRHCGARLLDLSGPSLGQEDISIRKLPEAAPAVRAFGERIRAAHPTRPTISTVAECVAVTVQRRSAAQMSVKHLGSLWEKALLHQVDHSLHGLPLIHRVGDHAFQPCR
jgi:hypothetical protein